MTVSERIRALRLLEKMNNDSELKEYAEKELGITITMESRKENSKCTE